MAIGTSDGETYPSHLEQVLDTLDKTQVAENKDIRTMFPHMPEDEVKHFETNPPDSSKYKLKDNTLDTTDIEKSLDNTDDVFVDQLHPDLLKLPQDKYEMRFVPGHELFHIRKRPALVGEDSTLPPNFQLAQYGPNNKDTSLAPDNRPDLYEDAEGRQRSRKNDAQLEEFDNFSSKFAKGLTANDVELIDKYRNGSSRQWTDEDQKRLQPIIDAVEEQTKHLPTFTSRFEGRQEYLDFHNWSGMLLQKIIEQHKALNPGRRSEADLPENAKPTAAEFTPDSTWAAMVDSLTNPDSQVPTADKMLKSGNYSKVVDWLTENGKTPGQEMQNWSTKEKLGYMLSTAMGLVGPGLKGPIPTIPRNALPKVDAVLSGKDMGVSNAEPRSFNPANSNIPGLGKAHSAMTPLELMSDSEFMQQLEKSHPEINSPYERALANQKLGRKEPTGDSADEFIQSLRRGEKPNLTVVPKEPLKQTFLTKPTKGRVGKEENDNPEPGTPLYGKDALKGLIDENPIQEPQGRPVPSLQQRQTQEAQRAANDRNYALGKGTERVNVGQGKGVLNDNKEEVMALIRKGSKPSEIARKYDITSAAVQQWIKRNGKINDISDILKD